MGLGVDCSWILFVLELPFTNVSLVKSGNHWCRGGGFLMFTKWFCYQVEEYCWIKGISLSNLGACIMENLSHFLFGTWKGTVDSKPCWQFFNSISTLVVKSLGALENSCSLTIARLYNSEVYPNFPRFPPFLPFSHVEMGKREKKSSIFPHFSLFPPFFFLFYDGGRHNVSEAPRDWFCEKAPFGTGSTVPKIGSFRTVSGRRAGVRKKGRWSKHLTTKKHKK